MSFYCATVTYGSTGNKTFTLPFDPKGVRVTVCQQFSGVENFSHFSYGVADGTRQHVRSTFQDATGGRSTNISGKVVNHLARVSGAISTVLEVSLLSLNVGSATFDVTIANPNYQLLVEAWD